MIDKIKILPKLISSFLLQIVVALTIIISIVIFFIFILPLLINPTYSDTINPEEVDSVIIYSVNPFHNSIKDDIFGYELDRNEIISLFKDMKGHSFANWKAPSLMVVNYKNGESARFAVDVGPRGEELKTRKQFSFAGESAEEYRKIQNRAHLKRRLQRVLPPPDEKRLLLSSLSQQNQSNFTLSGDKSYMLAFGIPKQDASPNRRYSGTLTIGNATNHLVAEHAARLPGWNPTNKEIKIPFTVPNHTPINWLENDEISGYVLDFDYGEENLISLEMFMVDLLVEGTYTLSVDFSTPPPDKATLWLMVWKETENRTESGLKCAPDGVASAYSLPNNLRNLRVSFPVCGLLS